MGTLYVVATPIGNLQDITERSLATLRSVSRIYAEDTRVTKRLLDQYDIKTELKTYHQHSDEKVVKEVVQMLASNENIAIVVDAGTPGISDPGGKLVEGIYRHFAEDSRIVPIPGASALTALASVAGISMDRFLFLGFPPHKKGRQKFFHEVLDADYPVVLYESTHRIIRSLTDILTLIAEGEKRWCVLGRELTKQFETIVRGELSEVLKALQAGEQRGEFVVIISKMNTRQSETL